MARGEPIVVYKKPRADGSLPGETLDPRSRAELKADARACREPKRSPERRAYMKRLAQHYGVSYGAVLRAVEHFVAD